MRQDHHNPAAEPREILSQEELWECRRIWSYLEPQRPDRSHGMAPWAAERIKNEPSPPEYRFHILPFAGNFGVVNWAKEKAGKGPPYNDWGDYLAMVRDYVAVEKHLYPSPER